MNVWKEAFLNLQEEWKESNFLKKSSLVGCFVGAILFITLFTLAIISYCITNPSGAIIAFIGFWSFFSFLYLVTRAI